MPKFRGILSQLGASTIQLADCLKVEKSWRISKGLTHESISDNDSSRDHAIGVQLGHSKMGAGTSGDRKFSTVSFTNDEKHRLYSAALAASESPLDTDLFKDVCKKIGIFDPDGTPNDNYIAFVSEHVDWSLKSETDQFRHEIDSKDKARKYIAEHL